MHYYLYRITNKVNGKIYVGVHKTKSLDDGYMGSGKVIRSAIKKHGIENFQKEILETFDTAAEMYEREKQIVNEEFLSRDDVYNLRRGGHGGFEYINSNPELFLTDNRLNSLNKGGNFQSKEQRSQLLIDSYKTGKRTTIFRNSLFQKEMALRSSKVKKNFKCDHQKGHKNSQFGSFWITNGIENKKCRDKIPLGWRKGRILCSQLETR